VGQVSGGWRLVGADDTTRGVLRDIGGRPEGRVWHGRVWPADEPEPDLDEYMTATMFGDQHSSAIDGCEGIEPDGTCSHGAPSWERWWGVI